MIRCTECEFSHTSESRVKAHFTIEHTAGLTLECQLCDARFRSKSGLQKHVYRVHKSQPRSNQITSSNPENVVATKSLPQPVHPVLPQLSPEHLSHLPAVLSRASGQIQLPVVIARQSHFHVGISRQNHLQVGISGQNQQLGMWDQDAMQVGSTVDKPSPKAECYAWTHPMVYSRSCQYGRGSESVRSISRTESSG